MEKETISGAEAMMRSLENQGVDVLFGYPGGAIMPTYDALYDHKEKLHHILVRHEQAAVHAAQGYARVSGKVGCAIVTSGPGAMNTITGVADALMDIAQPVCKVCISLFLCRAANSEHSHKYCCVLYSKQIYPSILLVPANIFLLTTIFHP